IPPPIWTDVDRRMLRRFVARNESPGSSSRAFFRPPLLPILSRFKTPFLPRGVLAGQCGSFILWYLSANRANGGKFPHLSVRIAILLQQNPGSGIVSSKGYFPPATWRSHVFGTFVRSVLLIVWLPDSVRRKSAAPGRTRFPCPGGEGGRQLTCDSAQTT